MYKIFAWYRLIAISKRSEINDIAILGSEH